MDYAIKLLRQINISEIDFYNPDFTKRLVQDLLNSLENLYGNNVNLQRENQELKDLINNLKGEKGHPIIKPNKKEKEPEENSKECCKGSMEKDSHKAWSKSSKLDKVRIDRIEIISIDKASLPNDAEFKGYEEKTVQNIKITTDNVLYKLEKYYSPNLRQTFIAKVPNEVDQKEFGADLRALCVSLYFDHRVTENKISDFLIDHGIYISEGTISNILTNEKLDELSMEKESIYKAGLKSANYQHIDDTGFRVSGVNKYVDIVCNENYSAFFIRDRKDHKTVEDIFLTDKGSIPEFDILISDDARQFGNITDKRALCWIHGERHYKKLTPFFEDHQKLVDDFRKSIWDYYDELKQYKQNPANYKKIELSDKFDILFSTRTGYDALDERIELTSNKKNELLTVLEHPEIPLHNNLAERGLRSIVVKRKISSGTRSKAGTTAWENYMTILETCKKQGVNFFEYIRDILSGNRTMTRLADLILS